MKNELEKRFFDGGFAADETAAGTVKGTPIVYNSRTNLGRFDEVIEPGALDGADLSDVRLCLNHDTSFVYARSRRNNAHNTMTLTPDLNGLNIKAQLAVDESPRAKDFYSMISRGDIDKMSFMFSVDSDRWEDLGSDHPTRHIEKIGSVVEVSAVTFPAYDATSITISARSKEVLENARLELENARQRDANGAEALELAKAKFKFKSKTGGTKR